MPDNTLSTLEQIRIKIRRLTKSPSAAQLTDATIDSYVNNFILYDFPSHLKLFSLRDTVTFYTEPYIDSYPGDTIVPGFNNIYNAVYENIYVSGKKVWFTQSREEFYTLYPPTEYKKEVGTGDGATVNFTGTLSNIPVLREKVYFASIDADNEGLVVYDDGLGNFEGDAIAGGTIDYVTGDYDFTFINPPADGQYVYSQTVPYESNVPSSVLYYNNTFTFRPVPDLPYSVELEVARRPTEILNAATSPELAQWWQYIAYGAAKKIFEDRMDTESVQRIMPEFKTQELLVNRRTIEQQTSQRTATIYTGFLQDVRKDY